MFRTNVASQAVFAQLNSRTDGSPLTTSVSVNVATGAGGSQAAGAGTLTHMGNGQWRYVPTQAETNAPVFAVQFTHASGVNVTLTCLTTAADPSSATRGLCGTSVPAVAAGANGGLPLGNASGQVAVGSIANGAMTAAAAASDLITAIQSGLATGTSIAALADKMLAYFQLSLRKDAAIASDRATELGEINGDEGSGAGDFDPADDSQQGTRDAGATISAIVAAIFNADRTEFQTAGSIGEVIYLLGLHLLGAQIGTVTNTALSPTATTFECADVADSASGHWVNRVAINLTAPRRGQPGGRVTTYTLEAGRGRFVVQGFPEAVQDGDVILLI